MTTESLLVNQFRESCNMASIIGSYCSMLGILIDDLESAKKTKKFPVADYTIEHAKRALVVGEFVWENRAVKQWNLSELNEAYQNGGKAALNEALAAEENRIALERVQEALEK
jgi:hypothetical protein